MRSLQVAQRGGGLAVIVALAIGSSFGSTACDSCPNDYFGEEERCDDNGRQIEVHFTTANAQSIERMEELASEVGSKVVCIDDPRMGWNEGPLHRCYIIEVPEDVCCHVVADHFINNSGVPASAEPACSACGCGRSCGVGAD